MIYVTLLVTLLFGYLLGSLNTSVIVSRMKGEDIRTKGSGNAGATNTLRVMGKKAALIVLLCDILKAVVAVLLIRAYFRLFPADPFVAEMGALLGGFGAILGHNYPLYFGFRGGKGVATSFGTIAVLDWRIALIVLLVFIVVLALSRYVSLASCIGSVAVPVSAIFLSGNGWVILVYALMGALCIFRHKENIARLVKGCEHKLGEKKKEEEA